MKNAAPKLGATIALLTLLGFGAAGCAADGSASEPKSDSGSTTVEVEEAEEAPEPVNLDGEWKAIDAGEENWQRATLANGMIEVYWVADGGETEALYWAGTVEVPAEGDSFSFDSVNDKSKTDTALLASGDDTKTFNYANDQLSYDVTVQGVTNTVTLGRQ